MLVANQLPVILRVKMLPRLATKLALRRKVIVMFQLAINRGVPGLLNPEHPEPARKTLLALLGQTNNSGLPLVDKVVKAPAVSVDVLKVQPLFAVKNKMVALADSVEIKKFLNSAWDLVAVVETVVVATAADTAILVLVMLVPNPNMPVDVNLNVILDRTRLVLSLYRSVKEVVLITGAATVKMLKSELKLHMPQKVLHQLKKEQLPQKAKLQRPPLLKNHRKSK